MEAKARKDLIWRGGIYIQSGHSVFVTKLQFCNFFKMPAHAEIQPPEWVFYFKLQKQVNTSGHAHSSSYSNIIIMQFNYENKINKLYLCNFIELFIKWDWFNKFK